MADILTEARSFAQDRDYAKRVLNSNKFESLTESEKSDMSLYLLNTQNELRNMLNEGTMSADIAQFTPIILPMVRRVYPNLIANELLGVQPMAMPTGYIYALVNQYIGRDARSIGDRTEPAGVIYELDNDQHGFVAGDPIALKGDEDANGDGTQDNVELDSNNQQLNGNVIYVEGNKILCSVGLKGRVPVGSNISNGTVDSTVRAVYTNEAAFRHILKGFTGSYTTSQAEVLGDEMAEIGFSISRKTIEAKSRALKGRYTVEMYQDLKSQHGLTADDELMSLMQYEIQAELDREIVDFVNAHSTQLPDTQFGLQTNVQVPEGRWEIERYRAQTVRIAKESTLIGIETKRGQGNILIVSPLVATMLEQVGSFQPATVGSSINSPVSGGVAGTFDNKYKVVIDQYATSDYCTVLYKGVDRRDAMGFFAPYVPLAFTRVTNFESGQPAIIAKTRYALTTIPGIESADSNDRARLYGRSFGIDFANTILQPDVFTGEKKEQFDPFYKWTKD